MNTLEVGGSPALPPESNFLLDLFTAAAGHLFEGVLYVLALVESFAGVF